jgi:asparagine synthase (glutamine-hydrolysing)
MGMAASIEIRVPFLDHEFASWVAAEIPPAAKIDGRTTKAILRQAMQPWLPAEVLHQPKAGFGAPIDAWLREGLRPMVNDVLSAATIARRGIFEPAAVQRLVDEHQSRRREHGYRIWSLLTLELWMRAFLDGRGAGGHPN